MQVVLKSVKSGSQTPIDDILVKEGQSYGGRRSSMRNYLVAAVAIQYSLVLHCSLFVNSIMPRQTKSDPSHANLYSFYILIFLKASSHCDSPRSGMKWPPSRFPLPSLDCLLAFYLDRVRYATRRIRFFRYYEELG